MNFQLLFLKFMSYTYVRAVLFGLLFLEKYHKLLYLPFQSLNLTVKGDT